LVCFIYIKRFKLNFYSFKFEVNTVTVYVMQANLDQ